MSLRDKVLPIHLEQAQIRISFINYCRAQQRYAIRNNDEKGCLHWVKEARKAHRELAELYRKKEQHDYETTRIRAIVQRMKERNVNAEVVERAHLIPLESAVKSGAGR